jgi:hypothetical protein
MDRLALPIDYGKWVMFAHGQLCLKDELYRFKNNYEMVLMHKEVLRKDIREGHIRDIPKSNETMFQHTSEFKRHSNQAYTISHVTTNYLGRTEFLVFWFHSRDNIVHVYEFLNEHKIISTWEELVGFVNECVS